MSYKKWDVKSATTTAVIDLIMWSIEYRGLEQTIKELKDCLPRKRATQEFPRTANKAMYDGLILAVKK